MFLETVGSLGLVDDPNSAAGLCLRVAEPGNSNSWALVSARAKLGILTTPGDFYGKATKGRVRTTLTVNDERTQAACGHLRATGPFLG